MSLTTLVKKLVLVLTTSSLITEVSIGVEDQQLERFLFIQYLVKFKKDYTKVQVLLDSNSEINAMTPAYTAKLWLHVYPTNVEA